MFCLATKHPDVYVRYAIDLAEKGKAKIGKLEVAPSSDCRATVLGGSTLDAVDWVTLAGLRDARNLLLDYQSPDDRAAGITMPSTLAGWFRDSELFKDVIDNTNLVFDKDLSDLVQANARRDSGYSVCLFIGAQILYSKPDGGKSIPNHWIVLNKQVLVGGATTIGLSSLGSKVDDDDSLQGKAVSVEAYTWGQEHRALCGGAKSVTVEEFLDYFYGYVCAK